MYYIREPRWSKRRGAFAYHVEYTEPISCPGTSIARAFYAPTDSKKDRVAITNQVIGAHDAALAEVREKHVGKARTENVKDTTIGTVLRAYLDDHVRPNFERAYVEFWISQLGADVRVDEVESGSIMDGVKVLLKSTALRRNNINDKNPNQRPMRLPTIINYINSLSRAFRYAAVHKDCDYSRKIDWKAYRQFAKQNRDASEKREPIPPEELKALFTAFDPDFRAIFRHALDTGHRKANVVRLNEGEVAGGVIKVTGKGKKPIEAPVPQNLEAMLADIEAGQAVFTFVAKANRTWHAKVRQPDGTVKMERKTYREGGRYPMTAQVLRQEWDRVRKVCGSNRTWHDLRRTFISLSDEVADGMTEADRKKLAGFLLDHSAQDRGVTAEKHYRSQSLAVKRANAERLSSALDDLFDTGKVVPLKKKDDRAA